MFDRLSHSHVNNQWPAPSIQLAEWACRNSFHWFGWKTLELRWKTSGVSTASPKRWGRFNLSLFFEMDLTFLIFSVFRGVSTVPRPLRLYP